MALGPEGDGIVKEVRIEKLVNSVNNADLTLLERRLFEAVINALILNRGCKSQNGRAFQKGPSYLLPRISDFIGESFYENNKVRL